MDADWKGPTFHCTSNSSHSKGVLILINENFNHEIIDCISSNDGRKLLVNIKCNNQTYSIANIYAPTDVTHRKHFFHELRKWITDNAIN